MTRSQPEQIIFGDQTGVDRTALYVCMLARGHDEHAS